MDCGGSGAHAVVKSVTPNVLPLGAITSFTGAGTNTGDITGASWMMKMTGVGGVTLLDCKGDDVSKPASCDIGLGMIHVGKATYGGLTFPQESGDITLKDIVTIDLAKGLPSFPLITTTTLTTTARDGKEAFCIKIFSKPVVDATNQLCDPSGPAGQCRTFSFPNAYCDKQNGLCTAIGCTKNEDCRGFTPGSPPDLGATCDDGLCKHSSKPKPPHPGKDTCGATCADPGDCNSPCGNCAGAGATHPGQLGVCRGEGEVAGNVTKEIKTTGNDEAAAGKQCERALALGQQAAAAARRACGEGPGESG